MARQLWLLRHGDAEPHGAREDAERRLTPRGERQAHAAGIALARLEIGFDAILCSPKVRARKTAELAAKHWSRQQRGLLSVHRPLASGYGVHEALAELAGLPADGRLLLVGHEPDLSRVAGELTGGRLDLKKGGLAAVRLEGVGGQLVILMRPSELVLIADGGGGVPADRD
jgi:phosphohistidine phosphatase